MLGFFFGYEHDLSQRGSAYVSEANGEATSVAREALSWSRNQKHLQREAVRPLFAILVFMSEQKHPLTQEEFDNIYAKVPRLTVEAVIRTAGGIVLTKIPGGVAKGQWNVPGGTVRFKETLPDAVKRVAKGELGVDVSVGRLLGYIEYPKLNDSGYEGWPVGMAFEAAIIEGELTKSDHGEEVRCFKEVPDNTIAEQAEFLERYLIDNPYPAI